MVKPNRSRSAAVAALLVFGVPALSQAVQAQSYPRAHAVHRDAVAQGEHGSSARLSHGKSRLGSNFHPQFWSSATLFQGRYGLAQDEILAPLVWSKLSATAGVPDTLVSAVARFARPLTGSSRGVRVVPVQRLLEHTGYPVQANGRFSPLTGSAVRSLQPSHRLSVQGAVNIKMTTAWQATRTATTTASPKMEAPPPQYPPGYLHEGDHGPSVRILQHDLTSLGYPTGGEDGIFGPLTLAAVQAFQRNQGLPAYGLVGSLTWGAIHRLLAQKQAQAPAALSNRGSVSATAGAVIGLALKYLGYPYVYGGNTPSTGFDCSGFVQWVYGQVGISLPRTTFTQWNVGTHVSYEQLQPGDLVFFTTEGVFANHVGIYLGNGQFISATEPGKGVMIQSLNLPFFAQAYDGAVQVIQ